MSTLPARGSPLIAYVALPLICAIDVRAQVPLTQLTACDDLATTQSTVSSWVEQPPNTCRSPANAIEQAIVRRSYVAPDAVCFLHEPPSPSLSRFSCMLIRTPPSAQMICFRPTQLSAVRDYKTNFKGSHAAASVNYMKQASKCGVSTGDTGASQAIIYPFPLMFVSKPEFGFVGKMKPAEAGSNYMVHAFGRVDPSLRGAPDAIEAVSWVMGAAMPELEATKAHRVNGWRIVIDSDAPPTRELNRTARQLNAPVRMKSLEVSLSRPADFSGSDKTRIDRLHAELVQGLVTEGFEEQDQHTLRLANGKSLSDALIEMEQAQTPYGMRKLYSVSERRGPLALLANTKRPACASDESSAVIAFVIASRPAEGEASEYGEVSLIVGGTGACARFTGATGRYVRGLLADAKKRVLMSFE